jgi:glycerophosphoryl diester phosphodiesterase
MKIIGHRGAMGLAPENTLASFVKAIEHHVDEVECDLRLTRDNRIVLHHDPDITDPSGTKLVIATEDYATLKVHKPDLALLEEATNAIAHMVPMILEVKPHVPTKPIIAAIRNMLASDWKPSELLLASFSQQTLKELHAGLPQLETIVNERWSGVRARYRAKQVGATRICMNQLWLWRGFIHAVHKSGYQLYAYTLNDTKKARRWAQYGLAGIVTDFPDQFEK